MNPRRAPQRIGVRHRSNQRSEFRRDARATETTPRLPPPEESKALPMPCDHRSGFHKDARLAPAGPDTREPDPQRTVGESQSNPLRPRALQYMKLMTEGQDLHMQCRSGAPREESSLEERDDDGRHQRSLSSTDR